MAIDHALESNLEPARSALLGLKTSRSAGPATGGYAVDELWCKLVLRPWSCLVVVSAEQTPNTLRLARSLAEYGSQHRRHPLELIDGLQLDLDGAAAIQRILKPKDPSSRLADPQVVIALDSPIVNPIAIGVLAESDTVLMLLEKGVTRIPQARKIIEIVGRERLIGAVLAVG